MNDPEWVAELEAVLTNVNEAHGCVIIGRTHRALLLLENARKTLEQIVETPRGGGNQPKHEDQEISQDE